MSGHFMVYGPVTYAGDTEAEDYTLDVLEAFDPEGNFIDPELGVARFAEMWPDAIYFWAES